MAVLDHVVGEQRERLRVSLDCQHAARRPDQAGECQRMRAHIGADVEHRRAGRDTGRQQGDLLAPLSVLAERQPDGWVGREMRHHAVAALEDSTWQWVDAAHK